MNDAEQQLHEALLHYQEQGEPVDTDYAALPEVPLPPLPLPAHGMHVTVKQGMIQVNQVWPVVIHPDVVILRADCVQKYPEIGWLSQCSLGLMKGARTLRVTDPEAGYTEIALGGLPEGSWECIAEAGRYTVTIAFYRTEGETDYPLAYPEDGPGTQLELPL